MKDNWEKLKKFMQKAIFWTFIIGFIYLMFTANLLSAINEDGIKGLCLNTDNNSPCRYNVQIQY